MEPYDFNLQNFFFNTCKRHSVYINSTVSFFPIFYLPVIGPGTIQPKIYSVKLIFFSETIETVLFLINFCNPLFSVVKIYLHEFASG